MSRKLKTALGRVDVYLSECVCDWVTKIFFLFHVHLQVVNKKTFIRAIYLRDCLLELPVCSSCFCSTYLGIL